MLFIQWSLEFQTVTKKMVNQPKLVTVQKVSFLFFYPRQKNRSARWIQGGMGYTGDLGKRMREVWHEFYLNGRFDSQEIKSWQEMSFDQFNVIGEDEWGQDQILGWSECNILDELQREMNEYTWGYTLETQNGPQK